MVLNFQKIQLAHLLFLTFVIKAFNLILVFLSNELHNYVFQLWNLSITNVQLLLILL